MIVVIKNRMSGAINTFDVKAITDVSRDSRTMAQLEFAGGESDEVDLAVTSLMLLPNSVS